MANKTTKTDEIMEVEQVEQKAAVNVLDLLLGSDVGDIKLPTKEVEITRLSEVLVLRLSLLVRLFLLISMRRYRIWHSL